MMHHNAGHSNLCVLCIMYYILYVSCLSDRTTNSESTNPDFLFHQPLCKTNSKFVVESNEQPDENT